MPKTAIFSRFDAPIRKQNEVLSNYCTTFRIVFVTMSGIMKDQRMTVPKGLFDVEI